MPLSTLEKPDFSLIPVTMPCRDSAPSLHILDLDEINRGELSPDSKLAIRALAEESLEVVGLAQKGWTFDFHDPAELTLGNCSYDKSLITLCSRNYTLIKHPYLILGGIFHEIAHALTGPHPRFISEYPTYSDWVVAIHGETWVANYERFGFIARWGIQTDLISSLRYSMPSLEFVALDREVREIVKKHKKDPALVQIEFELKVMELLASHRG